ncbi:hypothetical protein [Methylobacterium nonmethylotrophicum]|uniref:Uncharacterized protein n=1 Tax=Methylobacterium nonmethylotrophicum TaxID=1141884 RepID=A0A4Z0NJH3_9HYPH|nr:hypothetical protein [Methylobacterium nonmethylotrophicum]TGD96160.1 hypothetical protein EU555_24680 [Methylobacterium nonmethylotrophicum]
MSHRNVEVYKNVESAFDARSGVVTTLGRRLIQSKEAIAIAAGEADPATNRVPVPAEKPPNKIGARATRKRRQA